MKETKEEIQRRFLSRRNVGKYGWTNLIVKILIFSFLVYAIYNFIDVNDLDLKSFFSGSIQREQIKE